MLIPNARTVGQNSTAPVVAQPMHTMQQEKSQAFMKADANFSANVWNVQSSLKQSNQLKNKMKTPIKNFAKKYALSKPVRLHMPGHKGVSFLGIEKYDLTEINGADVLYSAKGIIAESMDTATTIFGSGKTLYSTEGSSLAIRAILHLVKCYALMKHGSAKILAYRNAHKSFITSASFLDIDVEWLQNAQNGILSCDFDLSTLESAIISKKPTALYVTSPDYLGHIAPVKEMAEICHKYGVILAVDNAHGAYLKFANDCHHPIDLGADLVCDSAHKTLPVLTGGAYLHIGKTAPEYFMENAVTALSLHASTSPSYLILQSLDNVNKILLDNPRYFDGTIQLVDQLKAKLTGVGFTFVGDERLKLTLSTKPYGYTGEQVAKHLQDCGIYVEFCDNDYVTMMFSPCNSKKDFKRLEKALLSIKQSTPLTSLPPCAHILKVCMPMNEAITAPWEEIKVDDAVGRILASPTVSCPPAIPVVVCGEIIDEKAVEIMKYYAIDTCIVVKKQKHKFLNFLKSKNIIGKSYE